MNDIVCRACGGSGEGFMGRTCRRCDGSGFEPPAKPDDLGTANPEHPPLDDELDCQRPGAHGER